MTSVCDLFASRRAWRAHVKEWLEVVISARSTKNLSNGQTLRSAVAQQLADIDAGVQEAVLKCFKVKKTTVLSLTIMEL